MSRSYYTDMSRPSQAQRKPIQDGLSQLLQGLQFKAMMDKNQAKKDPMSMGLMGNDSGMDPNSPDYYRGLLRKNLMQDQFNQPGNAPLPMGIQDPGIMYG